jgi:hypothetical protein
MNSSFTHSVASLLAEGMLPAAQAQGKQLRNYEEL